MSRSATTVHAFLAALARQDWESVEAALAEDVVRIGPYHDTYEGRHHYLEFLRSLMPTLAGYRMDVARVEAAGGVVVAELSETVVLGDAPLVTDEALLFDLDDDGRIVRIAVYLQRSPP